MKNIKVFLGEDGDDWGTGITALFGFVCISDIPLGLIYIKWDGKWNWITDRHNKSTGLMFENNLSSTAKLAFYTEIKKQIAVFMLDEFEIDILSSKK